MDIFLIFFVSRMSRLQIRQIYVIFYVATFQFSSNR